MSDNNYGQQGWAPGAPTAYGQQAGGYGQGGPQLPGFGQPEAPRESAPEPETPGQQAAPGSNGAAPASAPVNQGAKAIWKFSLRELILIGVGVLLIIFSFLPLTHGAYYSPIWGYGLSAGVAALAMIAATVLLFLRRLVAPMRNFRIGSLSIDQFASVAFSAYAIVFWGAAFGAFAMAATYGGFAGIGVSWTVWIHLILTLAGVFFTVLAPFVPPFRADFDQREEAPATRAARPAPVLVEAPKRPKPQPAPQGQWPQGYGQPGGPQQFGHPAPGQPVPGQPNPYAAQQPGAFGPQSPYGYAPYGQPPAEGQHPGAVAPQPTAPGQQPVAAPYAQQPGAQNPYTQSPVPAPSGAPADDAASVIDQVPADGDAQNAYAPAVDETAGSPSTTEGDERQTSDEALSALEHSAAGADYGTGFDGADGAETAPAYRRSGAEDLPAVAEETPEPGVDAVDAIDEDTVLRVPSNDETETAASGEPAETADVDGAQTEEAPSAEPEGEPDSVAVDASDAAVAEPSVDERPAPEADPVSSASETAASEQQPSDPSVLPVTNNQPFWALVPVERDVVDATGAPLFRIGPTAWALVLEERGSVYVVRHDDGRTGYLHDTTGVTRG